MIKLSILLLLLTIPFLNSDIYYGVPLWVYASLTATFFYAILLIYIIEKKWKKLKDDHE